MWRHAWMLAIAMLVVAIGCQAGSAIDPSNLGPKPVPTAGQLELPGSLVYASGNRLVALRIADRTERTLAEFPDNAFVGIPAVSHKGNTIAFTVFVPPSDTKEPGGADLYILESPGQQPELLLAHDGPGVSFSDPAWSADDQEIYFTRRSSKIDGGQYVEELAVQKVGRDGAEQQTIVPGAFSPSVSADGHLIAYLVPAAEGAGSDLWVAKVDGQQPTKITGSQFSLMAAPRFAPAQPRLTFAAVLASEQPQTGGAGSLGLLGQPRIAEAHGIPWDIWTIDSDGQNLTRLTDISEDSPVPTWSPDGAWIAFSGEVGVYLTDIQQQVTVKLSNTYAAGISWLPD